MNAHEPASEAELIDKLVTRWHLSVAERRALPGGRARGSLVREAIVAHLAEDGWFPKDWRPQQDYSGGAIELVGDACRTHWKAEIGVCRYAAVGVEEHADLHQAAEDWGRRMYGDDIDGIPIDWAS